MNLKKLLAGLTAVAVVALSLGLGFTNAATLNDPEADAALARFYEKGYTKYSTMDAFMPFNNISREQYAKFVAGYAVSELCLDVDSSASCNFTDVPADPSLGEYVGLACQVGILKGSNGMFWPTANLKKGDAILSLMRAVNAAAGEPAPVETDGMYYYENAVKAAQALGITKETNMAAFELPVTRYEMLLMIDRARIDEPECAGEVDITDLLEDLFGDNSDDEDMDDEDMTDSETTTSNGTVMATLSPETPAGDTIPGLASVWVASFDFTADDEDVMLDTVVLKRFGLGGDEVVDKVTIFVDNEIVSKSRGFNSSDSTVNLTLNPTVEIPAGETVRVDVIATVGDATAGASNQEFSIGLIDFNTNGDEDADNLPIKANEFEVAGVNAAELEVKENGSISDVSVGDRQVEVAKFELENNGDDDVFVTHITLEDDESEAEDDLRNFTLTSNGDVLATVEMARGKYVTFTLDEPFKVGEGESEDLKVLADVVDGATEVVAFGIDQSIYVRGYDDRYGYGLATVVRDGSNNLTYPPVPFTIEAGQVTLHEDKLEVDEIRADRDDVVLASFGVDVLDGNLYLEDISFDVESVDTPTLDGDLVDHFDNVELVVIVDGNRRVFDLEVSGTDPFTASDDDLSILLPKGADVKIMLEADTVNEFGAASVSGDDDFRVMLDLNCGSTSCSGFRLVETTDDEDVLDISPSSITFDTLTFVDSTVALNGISLTSVDVVKGSTNVDAVMFELETDDVSSASFEGVTFQGTVTSGSVDFDTDLVTALRLWKKTASGWELLEDQGGFDIDSSGSITFDDFTDVIVPVASTQLFLLTVDVSDNDSINGTEFTVELTDANVDDDDNNSLDVSSSVPLDSNRTIQVTGVGALSVSVDNNDNETDEPKFVLAGSTEANSDFVASFELTAVNETVEVEDLVINAYFVAGAIQDALSEIVIYDDDMTTELYRKIISSSTVTAPGPLVISMNNVNLVVEEGSQNLYVKVVTDLI